MRPAGVFTGQGDVLLVRGPSTAAMLWPTLILSAHAGTFAPQALKFPSRATPPAHVVSAQLDALRRNDIAKTYELFSRARRLAIDEAARGDARHYEVSREVVLQKLAIALRESCPGLLGHDRYEISSSLAIREYDGVHLPQWRCRVRCRTGSRTRAFIFHCTRQSDPPPPTIDFDDRFDKSRLIDGFEGCWFVWKIEPDEGGVAVAAPAPARLVPA